MDFALLSMDQLVNNAAKWRFMFGNTRGVPLTIRMIVGRGWGQGPTHSQNLQSMFAQIPGLKVVMPSLSGDAKGMLLSSIFDPDPVIFIEHRWLHGLKSDVPIGDYRVPIGKANIIRKGDRVTIVSMSYMTIEGIHAVDHMKKQNIKCELIDLRTIRPIDWDLLKKSLKKTGNLLVLDTGNLTGSISGEILAKLSTECWSYLKSAPQRLAMPDYPEATSYGLTKQYHITAEDIVKKIGDILKLKLECKSLTDNGNKFHDIPGDWFSGPF
jgi:pyruvate dehydrogenase E1 component beta subunit